MNSLITKKFLALIDAKTKAMILDNIANHYGATKEQVLEEITGDEAESLLDYTTGKVRFATSVLMQTYGLT